MLDLYVKYNRAEDIKVYLNYIYQFKTFKHGRDNIQENLLSKYPKSFQNDLKKATNNKVASKVVRVYLKGRYGNSRKEFQKVANALEEAWINEGVRIEEQLKDIYHEKIPFDKIQIYLTTTPINPHNFSKRQIMICYKNPVKVQLNILKHELNHFMFLFYYSDLERKIGKYKFAALKESLTVFTNPEEKGYPAHVKLREYLKTQSANVPEIIKKGEWINYL